MGQGYSEDEAITLMSVAADFGITQVPENPHQCQQGRASVSSSLCLRFYLFCLLVPISRSHVIFCTRWWTATGARMWQSLSILSMRRRFQFSTSVAMLAPLVRRCFRSAPPKA